MMEKQKKRSGQTLTTSVSVSKEFQKIIEKYNLSPTECFRRGVAVVLFDMGVPQYKTETNKDRAKYVEEFLIAMARDQEVNKQYERMIDFGKFKYHLQSIKKIIEAFENENNEEDYSC